ncbi:retention module-containing protein [Pseudohaliea rubra]|uniref:Calx-beta domain-containing protein n=1 Tax=Pseudohaliea rubra DSM 19751 TaxID=1265313 RepID=A0A095WWY8_9GAMM|nr:retention module-containing protein [Pseudohaliea rubra]KGE03119.1 hypothetical protein HRUBRA_02351 [Pseudohaliea rubra DSM 19751]
MATAAIATVTAIEGTAYARNAEGELRQLRVGDQLRQGETLVTPEGSNVELDLADGQQIAIADVPEVTMDSDMLAEFAASADEAALRDDTLDEVIAALEGDGDLSEILEATAAGAGADGTNAGSTFIRLSRIAEDTPEFSGIVAASGLDANAVVDQGEPIIGAELQPDEATTPEEQPVTIAVLDNDDYVEGAIVSAVSAPDNGVATINDDGTVTYKPNPGFTGQDTFTYTSITPDGNVTGTTTVTVDVTPTSEPPPPPPPPELPTFAITDVTVVEGDLAEVTVTLSSTSENTVTVSFASSDGTATAVSGDYDPASGTLTFAPGVTEQTILVQTNPDDLEEGTEFLNLELTGPTNAVIGDGNGIVEITDDFTPVPPTISIDEVTVAEGDVAELTLTLSAASGEAVSVDFATADDTATVIGGDYDPETGTVTFAPGTTTATVLVQTNTDELLEATERGFVNLSNPVNATLDNDQGIFNIVDGNEPPPPPPPPPPPGNEPPVAQGDSAETGENTPVDINILGNDADPDGSLVPGSVVIITQPENGTVTVDPVTGEVTYTPDQNYSGTDAFTYTVQDDDGATSNTATVSVVVNEGRNVAQFTDNWVNGVEYTTFDGTGAVTGSGLTGDQGPPGSFAYNDGDSIVFKVGNVTVAEFSSENAPWTGDAVLFIHDFAAGGDLTETNAMYLENTAIFLQALDDDLTDTTPGDGSLGTNDLVDPTAAFNSADGGINISQATRDAFADYEVDGNGRAAAPGTGQPLNLADSGKVMIQDALAHVGIDFTRVTEADPDNGADGNFENVFETIAMQHVQDTVDALTDGTGRETATFDARLEDEIVAGDGVITYFSNTIDVNDPANNQIEFDASSLLANATPQQVANTANMEIELTDDIGAYVTLDGVKTQVGEVVYDTATRTGAIEFDPSAITNEQIAAGALDTLEFEYRIWDWTANTVVKVEPLDLYKAKIIAEVDDVPESTQYNQFTITHSLVGDLQGENGETFQSTIFTTDQELTVRFSPEGLGPAIAEYGDDFTVPVEYSTDGGVSWQALDTVGTWISPGSTLPLPEFSFTWPANTESVQFRIPIFDDLVDETEGETYTGSDYPDLLDPAQQIEIIDITLGGNDNFFTENLQPGIIDNDPTGNDLPVIGIDFVIVSEGDGEAVFTFSLTDDDPARADDITVDYSMADLSTTEGQDYTGVSGTLTFAPGVTTQTITVPIIDDLLIETPNPEFALVNLSNPTNAVIGDPQGTLRIFDNDGPSVFEAGLPDGSSPDPADLVVNGGLDLTEFDDIGIQTVRVSDQDVTGGGTVTTPYGELVITETNGSYSWEYTLENRAGHDEAPGNVNFELFPVEIVGDDSVVRDAGLFVVNIVDDAPTAVDDTNALPADDADGIIEGDVFTNDALGADRPAAITGVAVGDTDTPLDNAATVGAVIAGTYGNLVLASDGTYEYTRTAAPELSGDDIFTYTVVDDDGDVSTATLTIDADGDVVLDLPPQAGEGSAAVDEAGLDGIGSDASSDSETTAGSFSYSAADTPVDIIIGGVTVVENGVLTGNDPVNTGTGLLTITDFDATTGTLDYSYELTAPVTDVDGVVETDSIEVTVTDEDGDSDTGYININIEDDVPTAQDDSDTVDEDSSVTIDAFANDSEGADGVDLTTGVALDGANGGATKGTVTYNNDGTFTYQANPGEEGADSFDYTITDADGDTSTATVSVTIGDDTTPTAVVDYDNDTPEAQAGPGVTDDDDVAGGTAITEGSLLITVAPDTIGSVKIDGQDVTGGGTVTLTGVGVLTVNPDYTWSLEQTAVQDHTSSDPINLSLAVEVTDNDSPASPATTTLDIRIDDSAPAAEDDSDTVDEDSSVTINVFANDSEGADGVDLTTGVALDGANSGATKGTVTYNNDGTFTYQANPGEEGADSFDYIITDADGDTSSATVSVTIGDDTTPDIEVIYDAGGLVQDADAAGSAQDTTTGKIDLSLGPDAPPGTLTILASAVGGATPVDIRSGGSITGLYGTLEVTGPDAGGDFDWTYTLDEPQDHGAPLSATDALLEEFFAIAGTDSDGDPLSATLTVGVEDDVPTMTVDGTSSVVEGSAAINGTWDNDNYGADGAASVKVLIGSDEYDLAEDIALAEGTLNVASDGTWSFTPAGALDQPVSVTFSVEVTDNDGDVASDDHTIDITDGSGPGGGDEITLATDEDSITDSDTDIVTFSLGTDALTSMAFGTDLSGLNDNDGEITWVRNSGTEIVGQIGSATAITLTLTPDLLAGTASVEMALADNVTHANAAGENTLALGSIDVIAAEADGSDASGSVSLEVVDDVPTIQLDGQFSGKLIIDEADIVASDTADFASAFTNDYGADGQGAADSRVFSLAVGSTASGLVDTATGDAVVLSLDGDDVVGEVDGSGEEVFRVTVDANGEVTLTQSRAVQHPDTNDTDEVITVDAGAISLAQTITDGDGDTAEQALDIGLRLGFQDDAPTGPAPTSVDLNVPVSEVSVGNLTAAWDNVDGEDGSVDITDNNSSDDGFIQLQWGTPASSGGGRSGYDFSLSSSPIVLDSEFDLGTFTHNNFPITGTTLDDTDLDVSFDIVIDNVATTVDIVVEIDHNETPNDGPNPDDIITITNFSATIAGTGGTQQEITVGDRTYVLQIDGFRDGSGDPVNQVFTEEGEASTFTLQARLLSTDDLPEAGGQISGSIFGADGPADDEIVWQGESGGEVQGTYGILAVQADGSWTYTMDRDQRDAFSGNQTETFDFFVVDRDGDQSASSLSINLNEVANQAPISLDLDGDGVEYLSRDAGVVFTDQVTGEAVNTAWVAGDDGLLVIDANNSGTVDEAREYVFTEWSETAETDMEAVAEVFDSNQNQMLDPGDEAWSQFAVWQDANSDGVTDAGELVSLDELGVESIALTYHDDSEATEAADGDVKIFGQSEVTWADGEVTIAEDTSFAINVADLIAEEDGAEAIDSYLQATFDDTNTVVEVSRTGSFSDGDGARGQPDQTITFEGVDLVGDLSNADAIQAMIDAGKLSVDQ